MNDITLQRVTHSSPAGDLPAGRGLRERRGEVHSQHGGRQGRPQARRGPRLREEVALSAEGEAHSGNTRVVHLRQPIRCVLLSLSLFRRGFLPFWFWITY